MRNALPDPVSLVCGIPQGSVAGPLVFTFFSAPLQDIISSHGIIQWYMPMITSCTVPSIQEIVLQQYRRQKLVLPTSAHGVRITGWY
ncbi:hypothetical protein HOLleu_41145 [Holothuria leucospilota]|uniref:Reverse transcriptase domain-containing protein n=1 Tax=Holothuria leucospilota TaxID=206669 RepID=A0A9Q0YIS7_HOLLE|nr:hypothetical protein HOLleu_41145 [Holothuria leucospilota]